MESRNIKVIDEHSIDRKANIICAFAVDGSDYVVYWIERDNENDNIFISKILKNIDGTSSMVNIDDTSEKERMTEVVKEIIKYSIDSGENKLSGNSITLPGGKQIGVVSVLFNKEQNINVQKTYVTTVKKAVTKVSEEYYDIPFESPKTVEEPSQIFETVAEPIVEPVKEESPVIAPVESIPSMPASPVVEPIPTPVIEPSVTPLEVSSAPSPSLVDSSASETSTVSPLPAESTPVENTAPAVETVAPIFDLKTSTPVETVATTPAVDPISSAVESAATSVIPPIVASDSVPSETVGISPTVPTPVQTSPLVFDATGESNLNKALGEASSESAIPVEEIQPVREFGVDAPVVAPQEEIATNVQTSEQVPNMPTKAGFANNKFFMVIAVAFFMASCVFLGYEVFNYFQIVK